MLEEGFRDPMWMQYGVYVEATARLTELKSELSSFDLQVQRSRWEFRDGVCESRNQGRLKEASFVG